MSCPACPCPDKCPGGVFCDWVTSDDPVLVAHVRARCEPPGYPSLARMAGNALAAAGRVAVAFAGGEAVRVPESVYEARMAVCGPCEHFDPGPRRCRQAGCGCFLDLKARLATEACPLDPPKWPRWEGPTDADAL